MTALNINLTSRSFKTQYTEHMKALTQPLMKSNLAENIFNTNHTYTNIETNLEILHTIPMALSYTPLKNMRYTNVINSHQPTY